MKEGSFLFDTSQSFAVPYQESIDNEILIGYDKLKEEVAAKRLKLSHANAIPLHDIPINNRNNTHPDNNAPTGASSNDYNGCNDSNGSSYLYSTDDSNRNRNSVAKNSHGIDNIEEGNASENEKVFAEEDDD